MAATYVWFFAKSSYVSFFGDVLKFFWKRMDVNKFRYIRGFGW